MQRRPAPRAQSWQIRSKKLLIVLAAGVTRAGEIQ
jgi:hypothetical protein